MRLMSIDLLMSERIKQKILPFFTNTKSRFRKLYTKTLYISKLLANRKLYSTIVRGIGSTNFTNSNHIFFT